MLRFYFHKKEEEADGILWYGQCRQRFEYLKKKKKKLVIHNFPGDAHGFFCFPHPTTRRIRVSFSHAPLFFLHERELTLEHTVTQRVWRGQFILFCYCFYLCCFILMLKKLSMCANTSLPSPGPSLPLSRSRINR